MDVDLLEVGLVHVGVGLDRLDEIRHPVGRVAQVVGERARVERGRHPAHGDRRRGAGRGRRAVEPLRVEAGGGERLGQRPRVRHVVRLEPVADRVLGVGGVEPVARGGGQRALVRLALEREEHLGVGTLDAGVDERGHRPVERVERVGERGRGPLGGRRRVVELVREPRRHLAERGELLALELARLEPRHHRPEDPDHLLERGRGREQQVAEPVRARSAPRGWARRRGSRRAPRCPTGRGSRPSRSARRGGGRAPRGRPPARSRPSGPRAGSRTARRSRRSSRACRRARAGAPRTRRPTAPGRRRRRRRTGRCRAAPRP